MVGNCVLWERSGEGGYIRLIRSTGGHAAAHLFTTGGGGEYNEGKRTLGQEGPMFISCDVLSHSMENIAKGTTDSSIEWFY